MDQTQLTSPEQESVETLVRRAFSEPGTVVDREQFLRRELGGYLTPEQLDVAVSQTPVAAGVNRELISTLAKQAISMEANSLSSFSKKEDKPENQYIEHMLRVMQKLAFLYGIPNFAFDAEQIPDASMSLILSFGETIFGLSRVKNAIGSTAHSLAQNAASMIENNTEEKKSFLPFRKPKFADKALSVIGKTATAGLASASEILGGAVKGGTDQVLFRMNAERLKRHFEKIIGYAAPESGDSGSQDPKE